MNTYHSVVLAALALLPPLAAQDVMSAAYGGSSGDRFDRPIPQRCRITEVLIRSRPSLIDNLAFDFSRAGELVSTGDFGYGQGGTLSRFSIPRDEYLAWVEVWYSPSGVVEGLRLRTDKGTSSVYGMTTGTHVILAKSNYEIVGFHGRSSGVINALGVWYRPLTNDVLQQSVPSPTPSFDKHIPVGAKITEIQGFRSPSTDFHDMSFSYAMGGKTYNSGLLAGVGTGTPIKFQILSDEFLSKVEIMWNPLQWFSPLTGVRFTTSKNRSVLIGNNRGGSWSGSAAGHECVGFRGNLHPIGFSVWLRPTPPAGTPGTFVTYGASQTCVGSTNNYALISAPPPNLGRAMAIALSGATPMKPTWLNLSVGRTSIPLPYTGTPPCQLLTPVFLVLPMGVTSGTGQAALSAVIPFNVLLKGAKFNAQWYVQDGKPGNLFGFVTSVAGEATIGDG